MFDFVFAIKDLFQVLDSVQERNLIWSFPLNRWIGTTLYMWIRFYPTYVDNLHREGNGHWSNSRIDQKVLPSFSFILCFLVLVDNLHSRKATFFILNFFLLFDDFFPHSFLMFLATKYMISYWDFLLICVYVNMYLFSWKKTY